MNEIQEGDQVVANRASNSFDKGDAGVVQRVECIDSDIYLFVKLSCCGQVVGPSAVSYWNAE